MASIFFSEYLIYPLILFAFMMFIVVINFIWLHYRNKKRKLSCDEYYYPYFDFFLEKYLLKFFGKIEYIFNVLLLIIIFVVKLDIFLDFSDIFLSNYKEKSGIIQEISDNNSITIDNKKYIFNKTNKMHVGQNVTIVYLKHTKKSIIIDNNK